jgi:hypothetical protein
LGKHLNGRSAASLIAALSRGVEKGFKTITPFGSSSQNFSVTPGEEDHGDCLVRADCLDGVCPGAVAIECRVSDFGQRILYRERDQILVLDDEGLH